MCPEVVIGRNPMDTHFDGPDAFAAWLPLAAVSCALMLFASASALAQSAGFSYEVRNSVQKGERQPAVILEATAAIAEAKIELVRDDGKTIEKAIGAMARGERKAIPFDQPAGTHDYEIRLTGTGENGAEIETSFETEVTVVGELKVQVEKDHAEITSGRLTMKGNRPIERVDIAVVDESGETVHEGTVEVGGKRGKFRIEWPAVEETAAVKLKAHDRHGFWRAVTLEPFWVKIPHDEVRFKFGEATWKQKEVSKLEDSLAKIREQMRKHGDKGLKMQLYIAGYTDTVGSADENRTLSKERARAIGQWFRDNGLEVPVYYQGFGEDVLAVETPDETKNEKNRRAIYILGNAQPPTSEAIPRSNWKRLE